MKRLHNVLIGADIEMFLRDRTTQEIVSAEGYIKGSKHDPFVFDPLNKYFSTSLDNVLAEVTIPPVTNVDDFVAHITKCVNFVNATIPGHLCTVPLPAAIVDDKYLQTENAQTFGCDPDYNVWLREQNARPEAPNKNLRSAGGHIHIGYDNSEKLGTPVAEDLIKSMDLYIGVPSVLQEPDNDRKLLYGKAGAFRFKPYGVEYRTVSNYYLMSPDLMRWAYNNTKKAVDMVDDEFTITKSMGTLIQKAINTNDKKLAEKLVKKYKIELA